MNTRELGWGHLPSEAKASKPCNIHIFGWVEWNSKILFAIVSFWVFLQFKFFKNDDVMMSHRQILVPK